MVALMSHVTALMERQAQAHAEQAQAQAASMERQAQAHAEQVQAQAKAHAEQAQAQAELAQAQAQAHAEAIDRLMERQAQMQAQSFAQMQAMQMQGMQMMAASFVSQIEDPYRRQNAQNVLLQAGTGTGGPSLEGTGPVAGEAAAPNGSLGSSSPRSPAGSLPGAATKKSRKAAELHAAREAASLLEPSR